MQFHKLHGLGNDYLLINEEQLPRVDTHQRSALVKQLCRRGFSVGADGVLFVSSSRTADIKMRIFNADGSEAESCGNGLRCVAYYAAGFSSTGRTDLTIEQHLAPVVKAQVNSDQKNTATVTLELTSPGVYQEKNSITVNDHKIIYHYLTVGNPHAVVFLNENPGLNQLLDELPVKRLGTAFQNHSRFTASDGVNVEFVKQHSGELLQMRVYERGVGETTSCGTGTIAIASAAARLDLLAESWVTIEQPGGCLSVNPNNQLLKGPASWVFSGKLSNPLPNSTET